MRWDRPGGASRRAKAALDCAAMPLGADAQTRKLERREEVSARLRSGIRELASDHTFSELRVDEIAAAAGLSRSAFYFYYPDKHDLLIDATREVSEELFEHSNVWWRGSGDPRALVRRALASFVATFVEHADLLRMTMEASVDDERVREFWTGIVDAFIEAVAERVGSDQEAGIVSRAFCPESCAEFLVIATEGYLYRNVAIGTHSTEQTVAALVPIWLQLLYPTG